MLESPLDSKEIKPVNPKGSQPWIFIGRADTENKAPILWPSDAKRWLNGKDPDAGKDWRREKGMTEDEMVGWYYWLNVHEFEQTLGDGKGQGSLACCIPWGCKESHATEWLKQWMWNFRRPGIKTVSLALALTNRPLGKPPTHFWLSLLTPAFHSFLFHSYILLGPWWLFPVPSLQLTPSCGTFGNNSSQGRMLDLCPDVGPLRLLIWHQLSQQIMVTSVLQWFLLKAHLWPALCTYLQSVSLWMATTSNLQKSALGYRCLRDYLEGWKYLGISPLLHDQ